MTEAASPLAGRRVLVTRTREQAEGLVDRLHRAGASVTVVPLIATVPMAEPAAIVAAAAENAAATAPRWVVFTSATAVRLVIGAAGTAAISGMLIAAVGPATAGALLSEGATPELVAHDHDADGLATALLDAGMAGAAVWMPVAEGARKDLPERLRAAGALVNVQFIYRSVMPAGAPDRVHTALAGGVDAITLTSGSTARNLARAAGDGGVPSGIQIVCIGEQTAAEARAAGLTVAAIAREASVDGLMAALTERLTPQPLR